MSKRSNSKSVVSSNPVATSATITPANSQATASSESPAVDTRFATSDELTYANAQSPATVPKSRKDLGALCLDLYSSPGMQANVQQLAPALSPLGLDATQFLAAVNEGMEAYNASIHLENSAAAARNRCSTLLKTVRAGDTLINKLTKLSASGSPAQSALAEVSQSHQRRVTQRKSSKTRNQKAANAQSTNASAPSAQGASAPSAPATAGKTGS